MADQEHNKLVRDKIPSIISQNERTPITRILNDQKYVESLRHKLQEEVSEYLESGDPEELADIAEVIHALAKTHGITPNALEKIRSQKHEKRGGFDERIFLLRVIDK